MVSIMAKKIKDLDEKLNKLRTALRALKNANDNYVKTNDEAYLLDIMGRLRALVGVGGPLMQPLLINLANELGIQLELYSRPEIKHKNKNLAASVVAGKTWAVKYYEGFKKFTLSEWLETPFYYADTSKNLKTRNQVIKDVSNNEGGSHYGDETPHIVDSLNRVTISTGSQSIDGVKQVLLDIAPLVYWLGERLLLHHEMNTIEQSVLLSPEKRTVLVNELRQRMVQMDNFFDNLNLGQPNIKMELFGE